MILCLAHGALQVGRSRVGEAGRGVYNTQTRTFMCNAQCSICDEIGGAFMLDFNSVLFMFGFMTAFGAGVTLLLFHIWGQESDVAEASRRYAEAPPLRKAA